MTVIAVDPGGSNTGIVVRDGRTLSGHTLIEAKTFDSYDDYLCGVVQAVEGYVDSSAGPVDVLVEGLVHPNPHMGYANVTGLINAAQVIGALRISYRVGVVRPGGHGRIPKDLDRGDQLDTYMAKHYPAQLLGRREIGGKYTGKLRHCRSAWDVSLAGCA